MSDLVPLDDLPDDLVPADDMPGPETVASHSTGGGPPMQPSHTPGAVQFEGTGNIPVAMLTGGPETDRRMAQIQAQRGNVHDITGRDALQVGALTGAVAAPYLGLAPVAAGALGGGLWSAGTTDAESIPEAAKDVAGGAAAGYAIPKAFEYLGKAAQPFARWLGDKAVKYGQKAITGVTSPLARRKPLDPAAVEAAFDAGAVRPFSTVQGVAERLRGPVDDASTAYAGILQRLEAAGVHGPEAEAMAAKFAADAAQAANNSIIGTRAGALDDAASALRSKALPISGKGRLGLMQAEEMKRELQTAAAGDFVKEGRQSLAGHARKEVAGRFREGIEDAVQQQAALAPQEAADFVPVKDRLHRLLQASGAAEEAAARAARRQPFGLHEAMGLASGIASGNPIQGVGAATVMGGLKERGASTLASAAHGGASLLRATPASMSPAALTVANPAAAKVGPPTLDELIDFLRSRGLGVRVPVGAAGEEE